MVRLLRISGVAALALAGLVLVSILGPVRPLGLGITADQGAARFLDSPSAVERFRILQGDQAPDTQDTTPAVVREAEALADIINPRAVATPNPGPVTPKPTQGPVVSKPVPSTAKFGLIGVCHSPSDPQNSFAYIRLPDNTCQWVKQGSQVGHLTVQEIRDGSILCLDGQQMNEMPVESLVDTASLLETGKASSLPVVSTLGAGGTPRPGLPTPSPDRTTVSVSSPASSRLTEQEQQGLSDLVQRLRQELQSGRAGDSNATPGQRTAAIGKLISEYKSSRVSPEEAQKLESLGEQLNEGQIDPAEARRQELLKRLGQSRPPQR